MTLPLGVTKLGSFQGGKGDKGDTGTFADAHAIPVAADEVDLKPILSGPASAREITFKTPRGLPGVNAVANDTATATYIGAEDSETAVALKGTLVPEVTDLYPYELIPAPIHDANGQAVAAERLFKGSDLWTFGHSYVAGSFGHLRVTPMLGVSHPVSVDGVTNVQRAVGGATIETLVGDIVGRDPFPNGRRGLVYMQVFMNSMRKWGLDVPALKSSKAALRTHIAILSASRRVPESDPSFVFTGTWTTATTAASSNGGHRSTTTIGSYVEITLPDRDGSTGTFHVLTYVRPGAGPRVKIENRTTSTVQGFMDQSNNVHTGDSPDAVNAAIPVHGKPGDVIRLTMHSGSGTFSVDDLLVPDRDPMTILGIKEPRLGDYSGSTQFPNGSDAATDAFNAIWDELAVEYDNLIVCSPEDEGYFDPSIHIGPDKVHPTAEGNVQIARCARDAFLRGVYQRAAGVRGVGRVPQIDSPYVPPTIASDDFNRADGPVGVTPLGGYTWTAYPSGDLALYTVNTNRLVAGAGRSQPATLLINDAQADGTVSAVLFTVPVSGQSGVAFRAAADGSGLTFWREPGGTYRLSNRTAAGGITTVAGPSAAIGAAGDVVSVEMAGTSITCKVNGATLFTHTDNTFTTNTRHGLYMPAGGSGTIEDFSHVGPGLS